MTDARTANDHHAASQNSVSDLPPWLAIGLPAGLMLALIAVAIINPAWSADMMSKEEGLIEHLTVLILIPGILLGVWSWWRRKSIPVPLAGWWILMWSLACVYFAGEEISWGQHYFGWETPDSVSELNDQAETNLHNMSSWLDQKPRAAVELFIIVAGIVVPLINLFRKNVAEGTDSLLDWVWGTRATIIAALMLPIARAFEPLYEWTEADALKGLASSELREQFIALFLSMYLTSYAWRICSIRRNSAAARNEKGDSTSRPESPETPE